MSVHTDRASSLRRGLRLEWFTITWNLIEAVVGMVAGLAAGSVALVGFALDSIVEASSGSVLLWRLRSERSGRRTSEDSERVAVRGVAIAFALLALYVGGRAVWDLLAGSMPEKSVPGIVLATVSLVVMPVLAWRKRLTAQSLDSRALHADSKQTWFCTYLSGVLLVGLGANALWGWWWADPVAAIVVAALAANEARELWQTDDLCCP